MGNSTEIYKQEPRPKPDSDERLIAAVGDEKKRRYIRPIFVPDRTEMEVNAFLRRHQNDMYCAPDRVNAKRRRIKKYLMTYESCVYGSEDSEFSPSDIAKKFGTSKTLLLQLFDPYSYFYKYISAWNAYKKSQRFRAGTERRQK